MLLFILSLLFIFVSSYFIASILSKSDALKGFIYTLLVAYAQIIATSEILSFFSAIKEIPFLAMNLLFLVFSSILWCKKGKPIWKFELNNFFKKCFNALKLDKSLWILAFSWVIFIFVSLYLTILLPVTSGDAFSYHVVRSYDWVLNHSLSHFNVTDIRITTFPINSEILYMWVILFTKKQMFLGSFTFVCYILILVCGYQIFKILGYSMRKTLWTLIIMSSFASVVVMVSGTETDLMIAGLILTSIYLFINALKNKSDNLTLFMSSLAYAIAIGIKTPAILCIPAVGLILLYFSYLNKDKISILKFIGFGIINFIIFSSFNYVLNLIDYGNIMGTSGAILAHKNLSGIKGLIANLVKHFCLFFDFSGINISPNFGDKLIGIENDALQFLGVNDVPNGIYCGTGFFNKTLVEPVMGCGIFGFLLVLPCFLKALFRPIWNKNKQVFTEFIFASALLINILILSSTIAFMTYNTRFLTCFIIISLPIISLSYIKSNKNLLKIIYIIISIFYLLVISTHLWGRPFVRLIKNQVIEKTSVKEFRAKIPCYKFDKRSKKLDEACTLNSLIISKFSDKDYKILFMPSFSESILFIKNYQIKGKPFDINTFENIKKEDFDKYDLIFVPINGQAVTNFEKYSPEKIDYYLDLNKNHFPLNLNDEFVCYYNGINSTISKQLGNTSDDPIQKVCKLTNNFFLHHPFYLGFRTDEYFILLNTKTFKLQ